MEKAREAGTVRPLTVGFDGAVDYRFEAMHRSAGASAAAAMAACPDGQARPGPDAGAKLQPAYLSSMKLLSIQTRPSSLSARLSAWSFEIFFSLMATDSGFSNESSLRWL